MKRFLVFVLLMVMMFCVDNNGTAFASSKIQVPEDAVTVKVVTNEVEYINELLNSTDEQLKKRGLSEDEILQLRNYDYNNTLLELKSKDDIYLKQAGFTQEQIEKIKL